MSAQVERLSSASATRMTVVAVVHVISSLLLPSMYSALRPGRVRYLNRKTTNVIVTRTQVTIVIQKMSRKIESIEGPKVEISCGKYIFSSIVKSHPYRAAMRPSSSYPFAQRVLRGSLALSNQSFVN